MSQFWSSRQKLVPLLPGGRAFDRRTIDRGQLDADIWTQDNWPQGQLAADIWTQLYYSCIIILLQAYCPATICLLTSSFLSLTQYHPRSAPSLSLVYLYVTTYLSLYLTFCLTTYLTRYLTLSLSFCITLLLSHPLLLCLPIYLALCFVLHFTL